MTLDLKKYEDFLHLLADSVAYTTLPYFRTQMVVNDKKDAKKGYDPVTKADRETEERLRYLIETHFPDDGIIGEEFDEKQANSDFTWVLDPIDGTRAFIMGIPLWGCLIGLLYKGEAVLGMMVQPFTQERFWGNCRQAFWKQGQGEKKLIKTRSCSEISTAFLATTSPDLFYNDYEKLVFSNLKKQALLMRYGTDCYAYSLLSSGHIDVVLEAGLAIYDIAPLIPIIKGAGGHVSCWDGTSAEQGGRILACGDPELAQKIQSLLK